MKRLSILGSTGSIGTQTLEVVRNNPRDFSVSALTCGSNIKLLKEQIQEFRPALVVVDTEVTKDKLVELLKSDSKEDFYGDELRIEYGEEGLVSAAVIEADLVVNALMGVRGLKPTYMAIMAGHDIALANKETLVAGGEIIMNAARKKNIKILPIDSEHSAIFQCLEGNSEREINKIFLTASGGPFRGCKEENLKNVSPEDALRHPNWTMGRKITIDSATMMNKGLEIIEAKWLFDVDVDRIKVLVHPQSIVHSAVEFIDKAVLAQMGTPDMRIPISLALGYPDRLENPEEGLDLIGKVNNLTFEEPDMETFKCLELAIRAAKLGGTYPAVMNGANEVLVEKFLESKIGFTDIPLVIEEVMKLHTPRKMETIEDILEADAWARKQAEACMEKLQ